jgi:hypothetical protein
MQRETIVFASGRKTQSIRIRVEDVFAGDTVVVTPLTKPGKQRVVQVNEPADVET